MKFAVDGRGAGFGNLEMSVNGGRVTSHVSARDSRERFSASFIPHEPGRHRVDLKFNGEKVYNSPWFVEVRTVNRPLESERILYSITHTRYLTHWLQYMMLPITQCLLSPS